MEEQCSGSASNPNPNPSRGGEWYLDTSRGDKVVHLLKCPPLVDRVFKSQQQSDEFSEMGVCSSPRPVGKVTLTIDPLTNAEPQFTMELAGSDCDNMPKCYSMNMTHDITPMCAFSQTTNGQVSVEGKVVNKFDMKPQSESIKEYGKLCRERTKKYMIKPRQLQVIDNDRNMRPMPGMIGFLAASSKEKKKTVALKGTDTKRTRRDRGEMEEIMFKLMERQPNWTLRQLIQETDQPEQFLKDILKDLCVYNNKGANQGTYELKPEYKKSNDETNT